MKKAFRYLHGTTHHVLTYKNSDQLQVIGYSNSDFGGCLVFIFMMSGEVVSWKSVKQTLTTTSTMEVEYVDCYEATRQANG